MSVNAIRRSLTVSVMKCWLLLFFVLLTAGSLRKQRTAGELANWGQFEEPSGQAIVAVDGDVLLITSGVNSMNVRDTHGRMSRVVREVSGDFDVRVRAVGSFGPNQQAALLPFALYAACDPRGDAQTPFQRSADSA